MTSLKVQNANEIVTEMVKTLGDEKFMGLFKKAFVEKEAAGPALEAYKADLASVKDENGLKGAWNKHQDALNQEKSTNQALQLQAAKAKELGLPGYTTPADDVCEAEDFAEDVTPADDMEQACPICGKERLAADFAINHLVKIADALDKHGFTNVANLVDEATIKIAKKKKESEEKEDKKKDKKDKKKKKKEEEKEEKKNDAKDKSKYKTHKGKVEKPPKGAEHKAPKEWFDKMKADVKKKNPDYSAKRINEIVGDIWDNELSDKKRAQIYKRYDKKK